MHTASAENKWRCINHHFFYGALFSTLLLLITHNISTCYADPATESRLHFQQGIQLIKKGKLRPALEQFLTANRLAPNPNIKYNIALCLDKLDKKLEAFIFYKELLQDPVLQTTDRKKVKKALTRLIPTIGRLQVSTQPPKAMIYVDRKNLGGFGHTPKTLALTPGKHTVITEKKGYHPQKRVVTIQKGGLFRLHIKLTQITGKLIISSQPKGAQIWVDDDTESPVGLTPLKLQIPPGLHAVLLKKKGHWSARRSIRVSPFKPKRLRVTLRRHPPPKATLAILSNVVGAIVEMDGKFLGLTPFVRQDLPPGNHTIHVFHENYETWKKTITLSSKKCVNVSVQLEHTQKRLKRGIWPWVSLGVTAAGLLTSTIVAAIAYKSYKDYEKDPSPTWSQLTRGRRLNLAADLLFGFTGLAGIVTLVSFFLTTPDKPRPSSAKLFYTSEKLQKP